MKYFGVMLDMSRNSVMNVGEIKKFVKVIKSLGYNMIMLYTEDTWEVQDEPYFGYLRGRYSISELKEVVRYCKEENMEIIPCIQTLAHLNQLFANGEYAKISDCGGILLCKAERTYRLIENMFKTLRSIFDGEYVHIGMDEPFTLGQGNYKKIYGECGQDEIFLEHLSKVLCLAEKYQFKPIMWGDMPYRLGKEKDELGVRIIPEKIAKDFPSDVELVAWDYYHDAKAWYDRYLKAFKTFNNPLWFAGGAWTWTGYTPGNKKTLETMFPAMDAAKAAGVDNIIMTMWGDGGGECSFYALLPSLYAVKRYYDGEKNFELIKKEFNEITGESFDAMFSLDEANYIGENKSCLGNITRYMLFSDPFHGYLDALVVDSGSQKYMELAKKYRKLAEDSKNYSYLFENASFLCETLAIKYSIGLRVRKAYQTNDKQTLAKILEDFEQLEINMQKFYRSYRDLWFRENKPHGFDVQDIRIGGAIYRVTTCKERLRQYLAGELNILPELEDELLPYTRGQIHENEKLPCLAWCQSASVNSL